MIKLGLKDYEPDGTTIGSIRLVVQTYMSKSISVNGLSIFLSKRFKNNPSVTKHKIDYSAASVDSTVSVTSAGSATGASTTFLALGLPKTAW